MGDENGLRGTKSSCEMLPAPYISRSKTMNNETISSLKPWTGCCGRNSSNDFGFTRCVRLAGGGKRRKIGMLGWITKASTVLKTMTNNDKKKRRKRLLNAVLGAELSLKWISNSTVF